MQYSNYDHVRMEDKLKFYEFWAIPRLPEKAFLDTMDMRCSLF